MHSHQDTDIVYSALIAHIAKSCHVYCNGSTGLNEKTQASAGVFGYEQFAITMRTVSWNNNWTGEKLIMANVFNMDGRSGLRDMPQGLAETFVGQFASRPMPKVPGLTDGAIGNSTDDAQPKSVHLSLHDKNVQDVIGSALLS